MMNRLLSPVSQCLSYPRLFSLVFLCIFNTSNYSTSCGWATGDWIFKIKGSISKNVFPEQAAQSVDI